MAKSQDIESLPRSLEAYVQSGNLNFLIGSGASLPAVKLAGDIEAEINALLEVDEEVQANILALKFIQDLEDQNATVTDNGGDANATETLANYVEFLSTVDELLFERKNYLLPRQANIFTTNYDLFVEHAATALPSLILNDGFDRNSSLAGEYRFAPEQFHDRTFRSGSIYTRQSEVPAINLFKLHGSLNWRRRSSEISLLKKQLKKVKEEDIGDADKIVNALGKRALILPNLIKFGSTLLDRVYYDLLRFFANSIEKENAVLVTFGFSFADEHILDITRRALRNPTSELIAFAYDDVAAADLAQKFESQRNAMIVVPDDDDVTDFPKFTSLLKSVAPGQSDLHE